AAFAALNLKEPEGVRPWFYPSIAEYSTLLEKHGLEVVQASLFERPTILEDGTRGLENWIRAFRQTFIDKLGPETSAKWVKHGHGPEPPAKWLKQVEPIPRPKLFHDADWVLDYRRLRLVATKL